MTTDARAVLDCLTSEAELLDAVLGLAKLYGWLAYHPRPARTGKGWRTAIAGDRGFPDLVLVRRQPWGWRKPWLIIAELKSERGQLEEDQEVWLAALRRCQTDVLLVEVWRPHDLPLITALLKGEGEATRTRTR